MACKQRPTRDADSTEVLKKSWGKKWEDGVDAMLVKAGKKAKNFADLIDKDRKVLQYISTSEEVKKVSQLVNDIRNDNVNLAREASGLFSFIDKEVSRPDGVLLTRALGGDLDLAELPVHLKTLYERFRTNIDQMADELVEMGALSEKSKMENYLKRYYAKYLEEHEKSSSIIAKVHKRKDLSLDERVDLSMIEDAGFVVANTILDQRKQINRYRLLKQLDDAFGSDDKLDGYVKVDDSTFDGDVKKWGALAGRYIPEDVMRELKSSADVSDAVAFLDKNFITNAVDHIKVNVTVKNPGTHAYNVASNLQLAALNGDLGALKDIAMMSSAKRKELWNLAKSLGLENELAEYEKLHTSINADMIAGKNKGNFFTVLAKNVYLAEGTKTGDKVRSIYQLEDEVFKVASFHRRIKDLKNPTREQLQTAMREAMADYVDYSTPLPPFVKWIDKHGLFPFQHYVWKSTPRVAVMILKNPVKFAALQASLYAVNGGIFNSDDDNYVKPKWAREEGLFGLTKYLPTNLFFAKQWVQMGEGSDSFINLGRSLPGARLGGLGFDLGFVGATASLIQGRDPLFKQKLYKDEDGTVTAIAKTLLKTSQNYLPPVTLGRYAQQWTAIAMGKPPKNHYKEDLGFTESAQRLVGLRKFNAKAEITNNIKEVIKKWKYDNISDTELTKQINVIRGYAKEHDVQIDNKKINSQMNRARKARDKVEKDFWHYLNKYTF